MNKIDETRERLKMMMCEYIDNCNIDSIDLEVNKYETLYEKGLKVEFKARLTTEILYGPKDKPKSCRKCSDFHRPATCEKCSNCLKEAKENNQHILSAM